MRNLVLVTITLGLLNCAPAPILAAEDFKLPITGALPGAGGSEGMQWSLPMAGSLPVAGSVSAKPRRLDGSINRADSESLLSNRVGELLDVALNRDAQSGILDKAVTHYRSKTQRAIAEGKDAADYVVPYRGFATSSEAGDVILDEKVKLKSRSSAEYARQKHVDETHLKIVSSMMQMAMGLGMKESGRGGEVLAEGLVSLEKLAGKEEAAKTLMMLNHWSKEINVSDSVYQSVAWDVKQKQEKLQCVTKEAMAADPVVHEIIKRIHN